MRPPQLLRTSDQHRIRGFCLGSRPATTGRLTSRVLAQGISAGSSRNRRTPLAEIDFAPRGHQRLQLIEQLPILLPRIPSPRIVPAMKPGRRREQHQIERRGTACGQPLEPLDRIGLDNHVIGLTQAIELEDSASPSGPGPCSLRPSRSIAHCPAAAAAKTVALPLRPNRFKNRLPGASSASFARSVRISGERPVSSRRPKSTSNRRPASATRNRSCCLATPLDARLSLMGMRVNLARRYRSRLADNFEQSLEPLAMFQRGAAVRTFVLDNVQAVVVAIDRPRNFRQIAVIDSVASNILPARPTGPMLSHPRQAAACRLGRRRADHGGGPIGQGRGCL